MAAIMVAAVFAGVVLMDDEADAVDVGAISAVSYSNGGMSTSIPVDDASTAATIPIADPDGKQSGNFPTAFWGEKTAADLAYWSSASGTQYAPGTSIAVGTISADDVVNGVLMLTAHFTSTDVTFMDSDEVVAELPVEDSAITDTEEAVKNYKPETGIIVGWSDGETTYTYDDIFGAEKTYTPVHGDVLTAVYACNIYWNVNGTIIASGTNQAPNYPTAPTQTNYNFVGWAVDGTVVISYNAGLDALEDNDGYLPVDGYDISKITADTTFTAVFEPVQLTVTLITGNETATQIAAYGEVYKMPALDSGYAYWATKVVKEVTGEDGTVTTVEEYVEFDFTKVLTEDITLYAVPEEDVPDESIYATFNIEGTIYGPYKVTDRFSIPQTDREGYNFLGWTIQGGDGTRLTSEQVQNYQYTEDVTFVAIYEVAEPPAPEEPAFYETTTGQVAIIIAVFVLLFFGYAVYSNMGGLKDKLFGYTISKKEKKE